MQNLSGHQQKAWSILSRKVESFHRKTKLEVAVVATYFDGVTGKRQYLTHGTDFLATSLSAKIDDILPSSSRPTLSSIANQSPAADDSCVALPDLRSADKQLSKLNHQRVCKLLTRCVRLSVNREPHWGREEQKPEWWPSSVPYVSPTRPGSHGGEGWTEKMRTAVKACYQHCNQLEKLGDEFDQEPVTIDVNDIPQAIQHLIDQYGDSMEVMDILTSTPARVQPSVISPEASDPEFLTSPIPQYQDNTTLDTNASIAVFTAQSSAASPASPAQQPTVIPMPIQQPAQQPTLIPMPIQPTAQQPTLIPMPIQPPAQQPTLIPMPIQPPAQQPTLTPAPTQPPAEAISKRPRESSNNIRKSKRARRRPAKLVE